MRSATAALQSESLATRSPHLDDLPITVLILDAAGRVQYANEAARTVLLPHPLLGFLLRDILSNLIEGDGSELKGIAKILASNQAASMPVPVRNGRVVALDLSPSQGGWVACLHDVTAYKQAGSDHCDGLTGLVGRATFDARLRSHLAALDRQGGQAALLCLDLDRFKAVNDTLGHPVGDSLLKLVAQRLRGAVRDGDIVARLGGDEFAVLQMTGEQPTAANALAKRLVDLVGRTYVAQGHMLNVGVSVGVALIPRDGSQPDLVARNADLALYRAKADGRSTWRFFEPEMDASMQARRSLEIDLRKALALKEFELVYQPQTQLDGGAVVGCEALLRWCHPERGFVAPSAFIPLAEEIGLMPAIGEWVLRTATREATLWPEELSIAVNISAVQFRGGRLVETVTSALAASGLAPQRLDLEITESALLEDTDAVLGVLNALRLLGVRVSMDDFGTGYSSLSYLRKFPFDKIKIDQSFVRSMAERDSAAIIRAVAGLGVSFGITTIAEGVETPEQMARITAEGCRQAQGYLISRPLPPEAARSFIEARRNQARLQASSSTSEEPSP